MEQIIFKETQRFRQKWIFILLGIIILLFIYAIIQQTILKIPFGDNPAPTWLLGIFSLIPVLFLVLFYRSKLQLEISEKELTFHFRPFHKKAKKISWSEIQQAYTRKYSPISEFGGWGLRRGLKGKAYTTSGDFGLQLKLKNGTQILLGSQKVEELEQILQEKGLYKKI